MTCMDQFRTIKNSIIILIFHPSLIDLVPIDYQRGGPLPLSLVTHIIEGNVDVITFLRLKTFLIVNLLNRSKIFVQENLLGNLNCSSW